uniref:Uncharacterized protein n=1 Tax=viral metagenome TaxID=1070528 RepID=A0A6H1ZLE1_9ZZZZ
MQIKFNDEEVKDIIANYVKGILPIEGVEYVADGYVGEVRVDIKDKPQKEIEF